MSDVEQAVGSEPAGEKSFLAKMLAGDFGLATTYWALYFVGAGLFAALGSQAVDDERWIPYLLMVAAMMAYTVTSSSAPALPTRGRSYGRLCLGPLRCS